MPIDLTPVFMSYLAHNRGPKADDPATLGATVYGVSATLDGSVVDLTLTFRAGAAYCCVESGCHMGIHDGRRWWGLRGELAAHGIDVPDRLDLRLTVVVEAGALLFDHSRPLPGHRTRYELYPSEAFQYEAFSAEASGPDSEPGIEDDEEA